VGVIKPITVRIARKLNKVGKKKKKKKGAATKGKCLTGHQEEDVRDL